MKIAFPAGEKSADSKLHESFGRAPYYLIYDTGSGQADYLDHRAVVEQGAAGIRAAQVLADQGVRAVITPRCGENSGKLLRNAEVLVYKAISGSIRDNIYAFQNDQLNPLEKFESKN